MGNETKTIPKVGFTLIINRYLSREVIYTLLLITGVLLLAFLSQQVVRYLNYVVIGKIATNVLIKLISFEIPYLLAFLLPLGFYLGILLGLGRLYADSEMAILELCGFSGRHILRLILGLATLISAFVLILMLWVNPWISEIRQHVMESDDATVHLVQTMIPGRFQASPDGLHVMYVEKLSRDRSRAKNIFLAEEKKTISPSDQQNTWMLVLANEGFQEKNTALHGNFFVTANGYRYEGAPGHNDFKIIQFKKYYVRIPENDVRVAHQQAETLSTQALWRGYANPKYAAEFQWRISIAISAFLLALLALPQSRLQPRQSRYIRLLPAILIYIVYINLFFIARRWVEQGTVSIFIGMWWVHGVALLLSALLFLLNRKAMDR